MEPAQVCFVVTRITASCGGGNRRLFADDALSIVALILLSCYSAVTYTFELPNVSELTSMSIATINYVLHRSIILTTIATLTMYFSKAPVLVLYVRIFGVKKWLRVISYATLLLSLIIFLTTITVVGATCSHTVVDVNDVYLLEKCLATTISVGVVNGSAAVVTDIIIITLPLPVIARLSLPFHKKLGVAMVFLTGIFAITASAISLYFKSMSFAGHSTTLTATLFCTIIECSLAIIVGCVPGVRACWSAYKKSALHNRLRLSLSRFGSAEIPKNKGEDNSIEQNIEI
ncbi:hypothetical protein F4805DRAFT_426738 [Annulohypoxylon moriforme]|nr:hypothetical protein F4805DRAFT_426738 [Annulohypoxylon moriforme]